MTIKWNTEKRKVGELIPYEKNPRILSNKQKIEIEKSLKKFSLVEIPAINKDNTIIAGHQRIQILQELYGSDYEIEVRVPNENLNEKDFKEYLLRSNRNKAEWDWNMLEDFYETDLLLESGFESFEVEIDKLNIDNCFADLEQKKKKIKVGECKVCGKPLGLEIKIFIQSKDFQDYSFKDDNDLSKLIYERLKDLINPNKKINIIISDIQNNKEDETISG